MVEWLLIMMMLNGNEVAVDRYKSQQECIESAKRSNEKSDGKTTFYCIAEGERKV